ncbi:MAG: aminotransferase class I/II-fold pyridoxal phosphate-dependent enzyme [Bacteroidetes bacterium]|nr:aminotransferase class I/II-fold pyridoxal phosphate-dependent enzyme [Bacteroidota bacterium]
MIIPLCRPYIAAHLTDVLQAFQVRPELLRNHFYTDICINKLEEVYTGAFVRLTKSCTQALEMAAFLLDIQPGDEVVVPSFIYVSAATAFVARGAYLTYVDIDPNTLNINVDLVERAITAKTKAIITVNYIGVACDYAKLRPIADKYNIPIIEDNAMGIKAKTGNKELGLFGDIRTLSI